MVAVSVMTLILTMFSQMLGSVSTIWMQVKGGIDNYSQARAVLNSLQSDLSRAVLRPDLGAFCNADGSAAQLAFYTERPGLDAPATSRQLQLVSYVLQPSTSTTTMALQRSALQIAWTDAGSLSFGTTTSLTQLTNGSLDGETAAQGMLGLAVNFLNADGSLSSSYSFGTSKAVVVSLAVIADQTSQRLSVSQKTSLQKKFSDVAITASQQNSVESLWSGVLNDTTFWKDYPTGGPADIRAFSRTYWLPVQGPH